jgi:hypothetical protein
MDPPLVFVVGNSRSGTTMVARMLGRHSSIHTVREVHFFEELWTAESRGTELEPHAAITLAATLLQRAREYYSYPSEAGRYDAEGSAVVAGIAEPLTGENVFAATLLWLAGQSGKTTACEQTPRNVYYMDEIFDVFPDARIIGVVRDPRDVLASQKNWWRMKEQGGKPIPAILRIRHWANYHPVLTSLLWRGGVRAQLAQTDRERVMFVRYEDVVTDPEASARAMTDHLGFSFEPAMLDVRRVGSSLRADEGGTGIDSSHRGQWHAHLRPPEVWLSQRISASEYAALGYEPEQVGTPLAGLIVTLLMLPLKAVLALVFNAGRSRNILSSVRRRLSG